MIILPMVDSVVVVVTMRGSVTGLTVVVSQSVSSSAQSSTPSHHAVASRQILSVRQSRVFFGHDLHAHSQLWREWSGYWSGLLQGAHCLGTQRVEPSPLQRHSSQASFSKRAPGSYLR